MTEGKEQKVTITRDLYAQLDNELYLFELMLNLAEIIMGRLIKKYNAPDKCIELFYQISNNITYFILNYNYALPILSEIDSQITIPVSTLEDLVKDTTKSITLINQNLNDDRNSFFEKNKKSIERFSIKKIISNLEKNYINLMKG